MEKQFLARKHLTMAKMIKISLLGAISFILMIFEFPLPIFPSFLKMDISDVPSLIGGFALGPVAAIFIQFIKNILNVLIMGTKTGGVGELSNFFIGSSFAVVASIIYRQKKSIKTGVIACICATIVMTIFGVFSNYFVMIPLYSNFMPIDAIVNLGTSVNPAIKDVFTLVLYGIAPFNILKGIVVSIVTMPIYKKISKFLKDT